MKRILDSLILIAWFFISSAYGCVLAVVRFGDRSNNRRTAQLFGKVGTWLVGMKVHVSGLEEIERHQPCIYVCNHQNYFDMAIFGSIFPSRTVAIGKKELKWIPFFNLYFAGAGNFFIDRKNRIQSFDILAQTLIRLKEERVSVLFFPEGTRNWGGKTLLPFKKGAFHLAVQAGFSIVPVVIADTSSISSMMQPHKRSSFAGTVVVKVLPPISTVGKTLDDVGMLTKEVYAQMQAVYAALPKF